MYPKAEGRLVKGLLRDRSSFIPQGGTEEKLGGQLIFETSKRLGEKKRPMGIREHTTMNNNS